MDLFEEAEPAAGAAGADGKPARPDWLPEQFWDPEKGAPRADTLAKSWKDMRAVVSRGEHKPPEKPDGYALPAVEGLPEGLIGGKDDPLWGNIRKEAHAAGVTQKQLEALATPFLKAVAEAAKKNPDAAPADPAAQAEADRAFRQGELAKLGPNGQQLVRDVGAWMKGLAGRGVLSEPEIKALRGVGSAEGVRALAKLRELAGEKAIPVDAFAADGMTEADARRLMVEGKQKGDAAMVEKARRALVEMEKRGHLATQKV